MPLPIELRDNYRLRMDNVLEYTLPIGQTQDDMNKIMLCVQNYMKSRGLDTRRPICVYNNFNIDIIAQEIIPEIKVYIQLTTSTEVECSDQWKYHKEVIADNCIMARFNGAKECLPLASSKINIFAYEQGYELDTQTYTIILKEDNGLIAVDIFAVKRVL